MKLLGKEVDRLVDEVNSALHDKSDRDQLVRNFGDLAALSARLLELDPERARKPYYAFEPDIQRFFLDMLNDSESSDTQS